MLQSAFYSTPLGSLKITYNENRITEIRFSDQISCSNSPAPLSDLAAAQILEFLAGNRRTFDFLISPRGTAFQLAVWKKIAEIPYGETRTYGQIAEALGKPTASRAVGQACNKNPLWIIIPCHRVIGKNQTLVGYAGGLNKKQALLQLEQQHR